MKVNLIAFGIAREILQSKQLELELNEGDTISTLKKNLFHLYPDFSELKSLAFAVGDNYEDDAYILHNDEEVVIIPPVSGG
jgi:molybdopterin converting factor small subunit